MLTVTYYGHSCLLLTSGEHTLIIDPFLNNNPLSPVKAKQIKANFILVTHGHGDHVGDAIEIAKANKGTIICNYELSVIFCNAGAEAHGMHIGGKFNFPFGWVKLTIAHHGGGYGDDASRYAGPPVGMLVNIGGKTIYHAGDTGLFYDMKLIGERNKIDLACLPIGDNYTMGVDDAVLAVDFLKPAAVMPIHYNTFPLIKASPEEFASRIKSAKAVVLQPGLSLAL